MLSLNFLNPPDGGQAWLSRRQRLAAGGSGGGEDCGAGTRQDLAVIPPTKFLI